MHLLKFIDLQHLRPVHVNFTTIKIKLDEKQPEKQIAFKGAAVRLRIDFSMAIKARRLAEDGIFSVMKENNSHWECYSQ